MTKKKKALYSLSDMEVPFHVPEDSNLGVAWPFMFWITGIEVYPTGMVCQVVFSNETVSQGKLPLCRSWVRRYIDSPANRTEVGKVLTSLVPDVCLSEDLPMSFDTETDLLTVGSITDSAVEQNYG